jgi:hypothetical protein
MLGMKVMKVMKSKTELEAQKKQKELEKKKKLAAKKRAKAKWLKSAEMQKMHVVPVSTEGLRQITIEMNMAQRLADKKLPQVRGTLLNPHVPVKLASTKGFVHWKIDMKRMKGFIANEGNKLIEGRYKQILKDAEKHGLLA